MAGLFEVRNPMFKKKYSHLSLGGWYHPFQKLQYSSDEFYTLVEQAAKDCQIYGLGISRVNYYQKGVFSPKREYLSITYEEFVFDVCAAPFGKDFFVSWWLVCSVLYSCIFQSLEGG